MGKVVAAVAILLVACGSEPAVAIQVVSSDPSITSVELFVGAAPCTSCEDGLAPPGSSAKTAGVVEYTGTGDRRIAAVGSDGVAGFQIEPMPSIVAKLAAVGFTADGTAKGFVLDDEGFSIDDVKGTVRRYQLDPDRAILTAQPAANGADVTAQVIVWRAPNASATTPSCLATEPTAGTESLFLVPPGDPDCDGIVENECDPNWYMHATVGVEPCFLKGADACLVGRSSACIDGTAPTCVPIGGDDLCVPDLACTVCTNTEVDSASCLDELTHPNSSTAPSPTATALHCTVYFAPTSICVEGAALPIQQITSSCNAGFAALGQMFPGGVTENQLAFMTPTFGGTLELQRASPCSLGVTPNFHLVDANTIPEATVGPGVLVLGVSGRTSLLPVIIDFAPVPACTPMQFASCELENVTNDAVYNCAR